MRQTDKHRGKKQTDKDRGRQTSKQAGRQTDRQTNIVSYRLASSRLKISEDRKIRISEDRKVGKLELNSGNKRCSTLQRSKRKEEDVGRREVPINYLRLFEKL